MHFPSAKDAEDAQTQAELARVERAQRQKRRKTLKKRPGNAQPNMDTSRVHDREVQPK